MNKTQNLGNRCISCGCPTIHAGECTGCEMRTWIDLEENYARFAY